MDIVLIIIGIYMISIVCVTKFRVGLSIILVKIPMVLSGLFCIIYGLMNLGIIRI